jgi:hypothetical protein
MCIKTPEPTWTGAVGSPKAVGIGHGGVSAEVFWGQAAKAGLKMK